jgi:hypothetical protein
MLLFMASFPTRATALIAMVKTCRLVITFIKYPKLVLLFDFLDLYCFINSLAWER